MERVFDNVYFTPFRSFFVVVYCCDRIFYDLVFEQFMKNLESLFGSMSGDIVSGANDGIILDAILEDVLQTGSLAIVLPCAGRLGEFPLEFVEQELVCLHEVTDNVSVAVVEDQIGEVVLLHEILDHRLDGQVDLFVVFVENLSVALSPFSFHHRFGDVQSLTHIRLVEIIAIVQVVTLVTHLVDILCFRKEEVSGGEEQ